MNVLQSLKKRNISDRPVQFCAVLKWPCRNENNILHLIHESLICPDFYWKHLIFYIDLKKIHIRHFKPFVRKFPFGCIYIKFSTRNHIGFETVGLHCNYGGSISDYGWFEAGYRGRGEAHPRPTYIQIFITYPSSEITYNF